MSDKDKFYRFRPISKLLGKNELEEQIIYFAPPDQLNDPMEGYRDIYWSGDVTIWKCFFRHYLLCLERMCSLLIIAGEDHPLSEKDMPVFGGGDDFPTEQYKNLFSKISKSFFSIKNVGLLINQIASRSTPVRRDELLFYLTCIHELAIEIIFQSYKEENLVQFGKGKQYKDSQLLEKIIQDDFFTSIEKAINEKDSRGQIIDFLFAAQRNIQHQTEIIHRYNGLINNNKKNKNLVFVEFTEKYIKQLEKLLYPEWYAACFMSQCNNSSIWGNYADNHTGACLIFRAQNEGENYYLNVNGINGWSSSSGPKRGIIKLKFYPIKYIKGFGEIDFFRSLGRLPMPTLNSVWYNFDSQKSECADDIFTNETEWRERYWGNFYRDITTKSNDWKFEKESRLILSSSLDSFLKKEDRLLNYHFDSLFGIIFGINTTIEDKLKIISIIDKKCEKLKRRDFKFFQAHYDSETGDISHKELGLLKITK
ncbi:DUF2971 domain-containing protein [uncultured Desulfuromusa sp.]|uniref:DUF2971 domain-containing protein n=1 Tax=uncultured Desulfuromusa sp. TaxID=219183 RepID=UPI002AA603BF|nr:DUF2971 domain-containing protein [uncultured Desulfuromusa sp.]